MFRPLQAKSALLQQFLPIHLQSGPLHWWSAGWGGAFSCVCIKTISQRPGFVAWLQSHHGSNFVDLLLVEHGNRTDISLGPLLEQGNYLLHFRLHWIWWMIVGVLDGYHIIIRPSGQCACAVAIPASCTSPLHSPISPSPVYHVGVAAM